MVPMVGSMGCPYTCSFCIDSTVPYEPMSFDQIRDDLRFLLGKVKRPRVAWHDPNFGVRFDDYMNAIEEAVPARSMRFVAESSLSLLSEAHVKRLERNGFDALLPGIESCVRTRQQGEDGYCGRRRKGSPGCRAREHDPTARSLCTDQLRAGAR